MTDLVHAPEATEIEGADAADAPDEVLTTRKGSSMPPGVKLTLLHDEVIIEGRREQVEELYRRWIDAWPKVVDYMKYVRADAENTVRAFRNWGVTDRVESDACGCVGVGGLPVLREDCPVHRDGASP